MHPLRGSGARDLHRAEALAPNRSRRMVNFLLFKLTNLLICLFRHALPCAFTRYDINFSGPSRAGVIWQPWGFEGAGLSSPYSIQSAFVSYFMRLVM
jgi:hypothetical protein